MSFKAIEARNENTSNLLRLWAFFDNKDSWYGLLQAAVDGGEQWLGWLCDMASVEEVIAVLTEAPHLVLASTSDSLDQYRYLAV
ncbi:hypothetical protein QBC36DRAFT_341417 [Triangularia setosa]|uniref:Uncharacterized protein n=1 Tax=Triangularia setosa TaxID=2587417 RepID=A0AAN6VXR9_9PEZI|nr:hypothetical protein QBC36DRAFT_341417 [Podospora setosa]